MVFHRAVFNFKKSHFFSFMDLVFGFVSKKLSPNHSAVFCSRHNTVLHFTSRSVAHTELSFVKDGRSVLRLFFLHHRCLVVPASFAEGTALSPWTWRVRGLLLCQRSVGCIYEAYFWAFCSVPWMYLFCSFASVTVFVALPSQSAVKLGGVRSPALLISSGLCWVFALFCLSASSWESGCPRPQNNMRALMVTALTLQASCENGHLGSVESSCLFPWNIFPFIHIFFGFFPQSLRIFLIKILSVFCQIYILLFHLCWC